MKKKKTKNTVILGMFATLIFGGFSMSAGIDMDEIPSAAMPISEIINNIPSEIKGISSVEFDDNQWKIKTVNVAQDIANQAVSPTSKFIEATYRLNPANNKFEQVGAPEYDNDEQLPPNYSSLKGAVETVQKSIKNSTVLSVEFDNGSWEVKAVTNNSNEQQPKQITKYIINPVNSVITGSSLDD